MNEFKWDFLDHVKAPETWKRKALAAGSAADARDAHVRPLWRAAAVLGAVAVVLVGALTWRHMSTFPDVTPPASDVPPAVTTSPTASAPPTTTAPTTSPVPPEGIGGGLEEFRLWKDKASPSTFYATLNRQGVMTREEFEEWSDKQSSGKQTIRQNTIYQFVRDFRIRREKFEEYNARTVEVVLAEWAATDPTWAYTDQDVADLRERSEYTKEEIDMIYSDDFRDFIRYYASPYAIVSNDAIYPPAWLEDHTVEEWISAGITADMVRDKVSLWEAIGLDFGSVAAGDKFNANIQSFLDASEEISSSAPEEQ